MTLPRALSILYNLHGSKNGAARSGASTPAPGLTINLYEAGNGFE